MKIYVIRHCKATGQSENAPLTDHGLEEARSLAHFLMNRGIARVVCSPYLRAQQTIEPYMHQSSIPIALDRRLSERVLSTSRLDNWMECLQQTFDDFDLSFDGGESSKQAMDRAVEVVNELKSSDSTCIALVTHGNLMALLLRHFDARFGFDEWAQLTNPDVFLVHGEENKAGVERIWGKPV